MKNRTRNAFTLVELLVASSITVVIIAGSLLTVSFVIQTYKTEGNKENTAEIAQLVLERMRLDLSSIYISPFQDATRLVAYDQESEECDTDSLTFMSCINSPVLTGTGTSDLAEVQYFIDSDPDTPERWLIRRFDPTPDEEFFTGGTNALLGPHVESLNFMFFDGSSWFTSWDSKKGLPAAINITIGIFFAKTEDEVPTRENLQQFSTTVWLPARRDITAEEAMMPDEESASADTEGSSGGGFTNRSPASNTDAGNTGGGGGGGNSGGGGNRGGGR